MRATWLCLRGERLAAWGLLLLTTALLVWTSFFRLDPLDEGYFAATSQVVVEGGLPYRDFATPYTPGFFYVNAWLFRFLDNDLLTLRFSLVVARVALLALLYVLARRLVPPLPALLPAVMTLGLDGFPGAWESHPAWWGTLGFVAAFYAAVRHLENSSLRWLVAAGALAAGGFAFKQNLGLFALSAVLGICLAEPSGPSKAASVPVPRALEAVAERLGRHLARFGGALCCLGLAAVVGWMVRAHPEPVVLGSFVLPFVGLAVLYAVRPRPHPQVPGGPTPPSPLPTREGGANSPLSAPERGVGVRSSGAGYFGLLVVRVVFVLASFLTVTLVWLVPLVAALGWQETPFAAFVGTVDTAGYYWPMGEPKKGFEPLLGLVLVAPLLVSRLAQRASPLWLRALEAVALGVLGVALGMVLFEEWETVPGSRAKASLALLVRASTYLCMYIPSLAFWPVLGWLLARRVAALPAFYLRVTMLGGSLLMLNQYPRIDEVHLIWSGGLIWIVVAYALWRVYRGLLARGMLNTLLARAALAVALLGLPLASLVPSLEARRESLILHQPDGRITLAGFELMALPRARAIWEDDFYSWKYKRLYQFFQERTSPDERIFVYPANPLMYYLFERRNATRHHHVFPGLVSPDEEQEVIRDLERHAVRWVVWDALGEQYWTKKDDFKTLVDYVWERYDVVESIGGFEVMLRRGR